MILGFDWFQSVKLKVDWVTHKGTWKNGYVAAGVPVHHNFKVELCRSKVVMHYMHANKLENSWFIFG